MDLQDRQLQLAQIQLSPSPTGRRGERPAGCSRPGQWKVYTTKIQAQVNRARRETAFQGVSPDAALTPEVSLVLT